MITWQNLSISYKWNNSSIRFPDALIKEKDLVIIKGGNASGKTTLLNIISKRVQPSTGSSLIKIGDSEINNVYKCGIGRMFQGFNLPHNIKITDIVKLVSRTNKIIPQYDEIVKMFSINEESTPKKLSAGQNRIIEFLLALSVGSKIVLLDEPLADLDPEKVRYVLNTIQKFNIEREVTFIITENRSQINKLINHKSKLISL